MSTGLFHLGVSGMQAAQSALRTTGHNIANAATPGYSRQSVAFASRTPQGDGNGFFGRGVAVTTILRDVNQFLQTEVLGGTSALHRATAQGFEPNYGIAEPARVN